MPAAQIANGDSGLSARTKLNYTLNEHVNVVRDFGADNSGVSDSKTAFQNAVTSGYAVFVPRGTYTINSAVDLSLAGQGASIVIIGEGAGEPVGMTQINSNFSGFVFDNNTQAPSQVFLNDCLFERLSITNSHAAGGCIRNRNGDGFQVRNCRIQGHFGVFMGGIAPNDTCFSGIVQSCRIQDNSGGAATAGGIGVMMGPETAVMDCSIVGFDNNIRVYGAGACVHGCRIEVGRTGILAGLDATSTGFAANGLSIAGNTMEGNIITLDFNGTTGVAVVGNTITYGENGPPNPPGGHSSTGLRWTDGSGLFVAGTLMAGAFTIAGVHAVHVGQNQGAPEMTFVDCNIQGGWLVDAGINNGLEGCVAINCKGMSSFDIPISRLTRITYAEVGARRVVNDCTATAFGTAVTNTGGTVAQNNGGPNIVPVWRSTDGNWYIG